MHLDVQDLRNFYYRSALGRAAQRHVRDELLRLWPENVKGQTVVGFGFSVPLLRPFLADARRVIGLMPGPQGVMPWPAGMPNVSVLCEEVLWPIDTGIVDKLVVMHGLETSQNADALLQECYRVLGPGGKAMFIVPNRGGLWSRSDKTPFGYGRPYTAGQLETLLKAHGFAVERHTGALYQPPTHRRFWLKSGQMWERVGKGVPSIVGGVIMVEVSKQVRAQHKGGLGAAVKKPLSVLEGLGAAEPKPQG
ncbi:methyltransferase domain-containing protein [Maritimibacter sp. DP1N21-5]|uniref:methyltransferase domain-containing protein n=1 Tax=Maritimibacter sp. DP1N21-5 TaxID=2836867 RepID=UPI001C49656C|nr:methyltransferase domain-containing protein [Maritimibacter sp. DP1N21-5]MBV7410414.1 class I SAM-dependent methyltransferase [Maritimibacter sp. DP1N21-5]